jgi:hypothetical protein
MNTSRRYTQKSLLHKLYSIYCWASDQSAIGMNPHQNKLQYLWYMLRKMSSLALKNEELDHFPLKADNWHVIPVLTQ